MLVRHRRNLYRQNLSEVLHCVGRSVSARGRFDENEAIDGHTDAPPPRPASQPAVRYVVVVVAAGALVIAALLISMGTNEGCLPWQSPDDDRRGRAICR